LRRRQGLAAKKVERVRGKLFFGRRTLIYRGDHATFIYEGIAMRARVRALRFANDNASRVLPFEQAHQCGTNVQADLDSSQCLFAGHGMNRLV